MRDKSFTLIELLVVIVIIGILAGVIMISTSSSINKANIAKLKVFEESVQNNLAANMVSAWDADHVTKGATWILNDKWGSNNGTFYSDVSTACTTSLCPQIVTDNQMGNVLSFDGVNDYISMPGTASLNHANNLTYTVWFKCSYQTPSEWNFLLYKYANNKIEFGLYSSTLTFKVWKNGGVNVDGDGVFTLSSSAAAADSQWHLAVATIKENVIEIWVDGVLKGHREDYPNPQASTNSTYYIRGSPLGSRFEGLIGDIGVYNESISSSEIKKKYIAGLNSLLTGGGISKQEYDKRIESLTKN